MKKIIISENQVKTLLDNMVNEQWSENQPVSIQMKKIRPLPNGKYCFGKNKLIELDKDRSYVLHLVKQGETISTIVQNYGGNSEDNVLYANNMLKNNPQNLRSGDVIAISLAPSN